MDPFSIIAGSAGLADVSIRLINFLRDVRRQSKDIEHEIDELVIEIQSLKGTGERFKELYERNAAFDSTPAADSKSKLWKEVKVNLESLHSFVSKLDIQVKEICGANAKPSGYLDATKKALRKRDRSMAMNDLRSKVKTSQRNLNSLLMMIDQ